MGAIGGYLDTDNGVSVDVLCRMNSVVEHRGPDDEGFALISDDEIIACGGLGTDCRLSLPNINKAPRAVLGLANRRLSITDRSFLAHQPMKKENMPIAVVFHGEIYNYLELKKQLESLGYAFKTKSDTEVLLNAYCEWGENCLARLIGVWAFALYDGRTHTLFCARDRLGAKPFYYYLCGNHFVFASTLKQICQDHAITRRFNLSYLAANLVYHISDYGQDTLIDNIYALKPGHKMTVRLSKRLTQITDVKISAYWALSCEVKSDVRLKTWCERVHEVFSKSCRMCLNTEAPKAALLSGGLDSSCMVAEMCSQMPEPQEFETYTTSYPGRADCDEWNFADMVNKACGCRGTKVIPNPLGSKIGIEKSFEEVIYAVEGFAGLALLGSKILLEGLRDKGIRVVFNGQCGDETMFGYERYFAFYFAKLFKQKNYLELLREFKRASKHSGKSAKTLFAMSAYFNLPFVRDFRQLHRASKYVSSELLQQLRAPELNKLLYPKSIQEMMHTEITSVQLPHICRFDDGLFMASSIESRQPFISHEFVELAAQIPVEFKLHNGYSKNIMREIYKGYMPKEVVYRTNKMGFGAPVDVWAKGFSKEYLTDRLKGAKTAAFFNMKALETMVNSSSYAPYLFEFLQTEIFADLFDVSAA